MGANIAGNSSSMVIFAIRARATVAELFTRKRDIVACPPFVTFKVVSSKVKIFLPQFSFSSGLPLAAKADLAAGMPVGVVHLIRGETGTRIIIFFC